MNTKQLIPLKKKVETLATKVSLFTITSQEDMKTAVTMLSSMNLYRDSVEAKKTLLTKPLNEALKNARAMFRPIEEVYTEAIELLRSKMSSFQTEQVRIKQEAEQAIVSRVKEGKGNLSIEKAVEKISALPPVEKEVSTEQGAVQFRETKTLKITDESLIPREYLIVDTVKLLKDLKEGKTIAGAEIEIIQTPVNYR